MSQKTEHIQINAPHQLRMSQF